MRALLIVDLQHGFIDQKDELPVPGGIEVIPLINAFAAEFPICVASQDWHPKNHGSFASQHPGAKPFEMGTLAGLPQVLWPDHCVAGTRGASFHEDFDQGPVQAVFKKGLHPGFDGYSAFADIGGKNPTGLHTYLKERGASSLAICGLALDYCVKYSALDCQRFLPGVPVTVFVNATRPVAQAGGEQAIQELRTAGIKIATQVP